MIVIDLEDQTASVHGQIVPLDGIRLDGCLIGWLGLKLMYENSEALNGASLAYVGADQRAEARSNYATNATRKEPMTYPPVSVESEWASLFLATAVKKLGSFDDAYSEAYQLLCKCAFKIPLLPRWELVAVQRMARVVATRHSMDAAAKARKAKFVPLTDSL